MEFFNNSQQATQATSNQEIYKSHNIKQYGLIFLFTSVLEKF